MPRHLGRGARGTSREHRYTDFARFCVHVPVPFCNFRQVAARSYEIGSAVEPLKPLEYWTFAGFLVSPSVGHPSPTRGCYLEG